MPPEISVSELIIEQITTILIQLERPVVQRQIGVVVVAALLGWLVASGLQRAFRRSPLFERLLGAAQTVWLRRGTTAVYYLYFPILGLIFTQLGAMLLASFDEPSGLILAGRLLFIALLLYRLIVYLTYVLAPAEDARLYHRRILIPLFGLITVLVVADSLITLRLLGEVELLSFLNSTITLGTLFSALFVLYSFIILSWLIRQALERVIMPRLDADEGVVSSILTVTRYAMIGLGFLGSAAVLGVNFAGLAVIGGGLSVGIGFGLQQLVSNFISGIFLLFEQSLRPGDVIEIDGLIGSVEKVTIRSTTVRTNDNVEIIVPNERFFITQVTTFTKSNRLVRVAVPIGTAYHSDPKQVREILTTTAEKHGLVRRTPAPTVYFDSLGDSSLNFKLLVWVDQPLRIPNITSDLYYMIFDALTEQGITIPFPQRDLNLGSGWPALFKPGQAKEEEE